MSLRIARRGALSARRHLVVPAGPPAELLAYRAIGNTTERLPYTTSRTTTDITFPGDSGAVSFLVMGDLPIVANRAYGLGSFTKTVSGTQTWTVGIERNGENSYRFHQYAWTSAGMWAQSTPSGYFGWGRPTATNPILLAMVKDGGGNYIRHFANGNNNVNTYQHGTGGNHAPFDTAFGDGTVKFKAGVGAIVGTITDDIEWVEAPSGLHIFEITDHGGGGVTGQNLHDMNAAKDAVDWQAQIGATE